MSALPNTGSNLATHAINDLLEAFLDGPCRINSALLSTTDGRLLGMASRVPIDQRRLAAISGSMLALAEACARELGQPTCRYAIVDSGQGLTIVLRVGDNSAGWVLTTIGGGDTSPGLLLSQSRQLSERLAALARTPASPPFKPLATS